MLEERLAEEPDRLATVTKDSSSTFKVSDPSVSARLAELRKRAHEGRTANRQELHAENRRARAGREDGREHKRRELGKSRAEEQLARMDAEDAGLDFDRKRAWDYTAEQSRKWDELQAAKRKEQELYGDRVDFSAQAAKQYDRNMAKFQPDMDKYAQSKGRLQSRSRSPVGTIVGGAQTNLDGSLIKSQRHTQIEPAGLSRHRTSDADIDRLAAHMRHVDEQRTKSKEQRERRREQHGDFINDSNRRYNQKIGRAFDRYTQDIRDSLERGTRL
ncbi:Pre-mRNA-splicing factor SYF2 [Savitreella phatthalungensis]